MIPKKLADFAKSLNDKNASTKLLTKIIELAANYDKNKQYLTKIAYYVDEETKVARLIFTDLIGKQSFDVFSGDIGKFISESHSRDDGSSIMVYGIALKELLEPLEINLLIEYNEYCQKKIAIEEAKSLIQNRYKVGDLVALRSKIRDGSKKVIKKFIVKKIIWSVNANPVNVIIVKQIEGPLNNLSMTKADCKKYHLKYEENLQVYSMFMNFTKIK